MTLRRSRHIATRLRAPFLAAVVLACLASAGLAGVAGAEEQQRAVLDLVVNDVAKGQVYVLVRAADIMVPVDALEKAGLRGLGGRRETIEDRAFVSLVSLAPEVTYQFDEKALSLKLVASPRLLGVSRIDLKRSQQPEFSYHRPTSAFANYGLNWRQDGGYQATGEAGLSIKGALATSMFTWDESHSLVRGLSSLTIDDRTHLRRLVLGDALVGDRLLGGSLFMGGIRVAREYSIDPYFIQYPTLGVSGAVTSPSTIEVYVDNHLVRQERVQPGQFELSNVPVTNGASQTRLVIRDAFGRQQEVSAPYYLTNTVLAKGLQEYEYAVGFARTDIGASSTAYDQLSMFGRHRYGLNDSVTAGMRAEARAGLVSAGPSLNARFPVGEVEFSVAASRGDGASGSAIAGGYTYAGHPLSAGVTARAYSRGYETLSLDSSQDRARYEVNGFVGTRIGSRLGLNLQQSMSATHAGRRLARSAVFATGRVGERAYAFASVGRSVFNGTTGFEGSVGLNLALGGRTGVTLATSRSADDSVQASVEVQRSLPLGEGVGYRVRAGAGSGEMTGGLLQYQNRFGHFEAGNQTINGVSASSVSIAGGLVAIGGTAFATRPVQEGFALVRVPGVAGVRTYLSNQEIGRTNAHGDLLVPNLLPYYANRLKIEDQDVPINRTVNQTETAVAPPYRGGALVVFPASRLRSAWGTIRVELDRQWIVPEFGDVVVLQAGQRIESPVGRQGEFYLENLDAGAHTATVRYHGLACTVSLNVPDSTDPVVPLGEFRCSLAPQQKLP